MAKSLGVSRNTVVLAYQGLLDDGYLVARERSGYFVADKALETAVRPAKAGGATAAETGIDPDWKTRLLKHPAAQANIFKAARLAELHLSLHLWAGGPQSVPARRVARLRAPGARQEMARHLDQRYLGLR